jgi:hypothetical protein
MVLQGPWEYQFHLAMEMLTTIQNLSFSGDDPDKRWQSRMKGMSIWSLAPKTSPRMVRQLSDISA